MKALKNKIGYEYTFPTNGWGCRVAPRPARPYTAIQIPLVEARQMHRSRWLLHAMGAAVAFAQPL